MFFAQRRKMKLRTSAALSLGSLLVCGLLWAFWFGRSATPPAPVVLLTRPFSPPVLFRDKVLRWIPPGAGWNWARALALNHRKAVNFQTEVFTVRSPMDTGELGLGAPIFSNATGVQVWFVKGNALKQIRQHLNASPAVRGFMGSRVSTADGIGATLFSGQTLVLQGATNQVGLQTEYYAAVHPSRTDLFLGAFLSELVTNEPGATVTSGIGVVTNLDLAARLQVPRGCGVVLLTRSEPPANVRGAGLVLEVR